MPNYFDDDDIDDDALVAVLCADRPAPPPPLLPPSSSFPDRHAPTQNGTETTTFFQCDDDFDDDALAAVLQVDSVSNWNEPAVIVSSRPPAQTHNIDCDDFDDECFIVAVEEARPEAVPARRPASSRSYPSQQTKIGHYFQRSPVDRDLARSAIADFNLGARTPLIADVDAVSKVVYPINFPRRDYQVDCVESAVRENTLVVLPTGLGKTFVASVLVSNMLRWFPTGKCVFMAPTRQLVLQQAKACCEMAPIPHDAVKVMLNVQPNVRGSVWSQYRLIFCTPQIVEKDIQNDRCPLDEIVCFVFDEAHHSVGNSAMAGIVAKRFEVDNRFRVLALSATPGSDRSQVQTVTDNLLIKRILPFHRKDPAIAKYVNDREEEIIKIDLTEETRNLLNILDEVCKKSAKILESHGLLMLNFTMLGPGYFQGEAFMNRLRERRLQENWGVLNSKFILQALLSARQYLCNYSMLAFVTQLEHAFSSSTNKAFVSVSKEAAFTAAVQMAKDYLSRSVLHPKLQRLRELVTSHFQACPESRAIIFVEYKMIVDEIVSCISNCPGTLPIRFVGQQKSAGAGDTVGMRPKEQSEAMERFRSGTANVLVATCIGEEGLDIGEVDLVISYDTTSSALRTTQRMGRTARQRRGRCVSLIMEGNELRSYENNLKNVESSFRLLRSNYVKLSTIPCSIRPPNLPIHLTFEHSSDICPWNPSPQPVKKRSGSLRAKSSSIALSSQGQRELEQMWALDETELGGIQPRLVTSADEVQEPLRRLFGCSEISKILINTMDLITKVRLGRMEVDSGNISPLPCSPARGAIQAPRTPLRQPQGSPPRRSWFSPEKPSSNSDDELNDLLDDIELLSQPAGPHLNSATVPTARAHFCKTSSPTATSPSDGPGPIVHLQEDDPLNVTGRYDEVLPYRAPPVETEKSKDSSRPDRITMTERSFNQPRSAVCTTAASKDLPGAAISSKVAAKRAPARSTKKTARKKPKFGSATINRLSSPFFKGDAPRREAELPSSIQQFYFQTSLASKDRRDYVQFHLGLRYESQIPNREPYVRFRVPVSPTSTNSLSNLALPVSCMKAKTPPPD